MWENYVVIQWLKYRDWHDSSIGLWYWRDQSGAEVDLLLERNQKLTPIECKCTEKPGSKALHGIKKLKKFYGDDTIRQSFTACPIELGYEIEPGHSVESGWKIWNIE